MFNEIKKSYKIFSIEKDKTFDFLSVNRGRNFLPLTQRSLTPP